MIKKSYNEINNITTTDEINNTNEYSKNEPKPNKYDNHILINEFTKEFEKVVELFYDKKLSNEDKLLNIGNINKIIFIIIL